MQLVCATTGNGLLGDDHDANIQIREVRTRATGEFGPVQAGRTMAARTTGEREDGGAGWEKGGGAL